MNGFIRKLLIISCAALSNASVAMASQEASGNSSKGFVYPPAPDRPATIEDQSWPLDPKIEELSVAIGLAAQSYPAVLVAKSNEKAARAALRGANWQRFPSLSVEAIGAGSGTQSDVAFTAEQPLWTGGRIGGSIRASRAQLDASKAAIDEVRLDTALQVASAFFDIQRLVQREVILEESLEEHLKLVDSMARRVEAELSPASDLELARSRAAQVEQDLVLSQGQRRVALVRLRELTGDLAFQVTKVVSYDPALHHPEPAGLIDAALNFDPRRRRLAAEVAAASAGIDVARAALFPQVNAQYQKPMFGNDRVGIVLRAQTDGGLSRFSAVDTATQRRSSAQFAILTSERELRQAVEADILENELARNRIASSSVSTRSSKAVTESFMRQFVTGRRTWLDVMNAVRESTSARLVEVDARVSAIASSARLAIRSGGWRPQVVSEDQL